MHKFLVYNKFIIFLYMFRALLCSEHVQEYNKLIIKPRICALSWSLTNDYVNNPQATEETINF